MPLSNRGPAPNPTAIGIDAMAVYVPSYRVRLADFAGWTQQDAEKLTAVVGRSFRMAAPDENVYTMTATAVIRVITQSGLDPSRIGFLALGTESSVDNAAGAVIVRGLVDRGLEALGLSKLPRTVEVPEFKHACLGGVYALKAAARYIACDGAGRVAIVVSGDIAEYARGSTGEPTQGAGAVAMVVSAAPRLFEMDFAKMGSSSGYRGLDFRKPARRHHVPGYEVQAARPHDFPVFNGKYSTACYVEAVVQATRDLAARTGQSVLALVDTADYIVMHRPYRKMPIDGLSAIVTSALASDAASDETAAFFARAKVDPADVLAELAPTRELLPFVEEHGVDAEVSPALTMATKALRTHPRHAEWVTAKLELGAAAMMDLGNLYTAALPAWLASAAEEGARGECPIAGRTLLAIGYGSGDAAEALVLRATDRDRFTEAARHIGFAAALEAAVDLDRGGYETLHDGTGSALSVQLDGLPNADARGTFRITRVGSTNTSKLQDVGIEYYRWMR